MMKKTATLFVVFLVSIISVFASSVVLTPTNSGDEYIYDYDYQNTITIDYQDSGNNFRAHIYGTGLKPGFTYQVKLIGVPSCAGGNDYTNELIGYSGRWYCPLCSGSEVSKNRNDAQYEANKITNAECIHGYLVFGYITADENGNVDANVVSDKSYHVLRCGSGDSQLYYVNKEEYPFDSYSLKCEAPMLCNGENVIGEIERPSFSKLPVGNYANVAIGLTEESFHKSCGTWTNVLLGNTSFIVNNGQQIPEFTSIGLGIAVLGSGICYFTLRKRK